MITLAPPAQRFSRASCPTRALDCAHCGLEVPAGMVEDGCDQQFCCSGCRVAYDVIHGAGLERFYRLAQGSSRIAVRLSGRTFAEFDDEVFERIYCRACAGSLRSTELMLEGVHCPACVWLLERLAAVAPGVIDARLDLRRAILHVTWDSDRIRLSQVARTLAALGYTPHPARGIRAREVRRLEDRRALVRIAVAGACASNVMLLAVALYAGVFDAMDQIHLQLFRWTSMLLSVVAMAWPGSVFLRSAWAALRTRTPHLDVPIALGLTLGTLWGVWNTVRGTGDIYFDSIAALIFFLLVGRFVQSRQQRFAADSVELLFSLTPSAAHQVLEDGVRDVTVESLRAGDTVEVRAGECIPADGVVVAGRSDIDRSLLTGESRSSPAANGEEVHAGTVAVSGVLRVRVIATGEQTRIGRLARLIEEGAAHKGRFVRLADTFASRFVLVLLGLAVITLGLWWRIDPHRAVEYAIAMVVVTCPCGLGLATPLLMSTALGRAARRGLLIKSSQALECLATPGTLLIDKTGTITHGRTRLLAWWGDESARRLVRAVEACSSHHAAKAMLEALDDRRPVLDARSAQDQAGGVTGIVEGHVVRVGSPAFVRSSPVVESCEISRWEQEALTHELSPVLISIDGRVVAVAGLGDSPRADASRSLALLVSSGWKVRIISGDHPSIVARVARQVGVDPDVCMGGQTPEDKLRVLEEEKVHGPVVMVGDGVNDAPALAAATVGIAVHAGAEASLAAADVYLSQEGLSPIVDLMTGARRTMRALRLAIAVSLAYNVAVAALTMAGFISPLLAAILMPAASFSVLVLAIKCRTFDNRRTKGVA